MAGPKAEKAVAELAREYPDACVAALRDVEAKLAAVEELVSVVVWDRRVEKAESYLLTDAQTHRDGATYRGRGGRVGDTPG